MALHCMDNFSFTCKKIEIVQPQGPRCCLFRKVRLLRSADAVQGSLHAPEGELPGAHRGDCASVCLLRKFSDH